MSGPELTLLILRSVRAPGPDEAGDAYAQRFDTAFAPRVIGNLRNDDAFCTACGDRCSHCRRPYKRSFADRIAGIIDFPDRLPHLLESPEAWLPDPLPAHHILLAVAVHEQILLEVLRRAPELGTRGVIVPIERPGWISPAGQHCAQEICRQNDVEIAFPKPFCALAPPPDSVLGQFRDTFHIGRPNVEVTVHDGAIKRAHVRVSAACGATYYIARGLTGKTLDHDLKYDIVARRLHSYPCTASMDWDEELGDTILHVSGEAHYEILAGIAPAHQDRQEFVRTPLGQVLPKPVPPHENIANIEMAREAVLAATADGQRVPLTTLRTLSKSPPAALSTAILLLKKDGLIRAGQGHVWRANQSPPQSCPTSR